MQLSQQKFYLFECGKCLIQWVFFEGNNFPHQIMRYTSCLRKVVLFNRSNFVSSGHLSLLGDVLCCHHLRLRDKKCCLLFYSVQCNFENNYLVQNIPIPIFDKHCLTQSFKHPLIRKMSMHCVMINLHCQLE